MLKIKTKLYENNKENGNSHYVSNIIINTGAKIITNP
jgi:hypothetical protein